MTREKALEAMDRLVAMGYHVGLSEYDLGEHGHVMIGDDGKTTSLRRWLTIESLSLDKVDLRALVQFADDLGMDVGWNGIQNNKISFTDQIDRVRASGADVYDDAGWVRGQRRKHPR